jgi:ribosomal subunit interface protein
MEFHLRGQRLTLSDALKAYMERRLGFALAGIAAHVKDVEIRVRDVNGPRGGIDKSCAITVAIRRLGVVFASARGVDAYATVDRAASRIRSVLTRRLSRRRDRRLAQRRFGDSRRWRRKRADK